MSAPELPPLPPTMCRVHGESYYTPEHVERLRREAYELGQRPAGAEPVGYMWKDLTTAGGISTHVGKEPPPYIPTSELTPLYAAPSSVPAPRAALAEQKAEQQAQPVVPEGWQLVPKRLTPAMHAAAFTAGRGQPPGWFDLMYEAALAAAPSLPTGSESAAG